MGLMRPFSTILLLALVICGGTQVRAGDMAAVGRIEFANGPGTCSGTLVREDLVVTAAHCVSDDGRAQVFRPGDGPDGEVFAVDRFVFHPLYDEAAGRPEWRFRFDIALLHLAKPVPADRAAPLAVGTEAVPGETLYLVSWRRGEGSRPRQRKCPVLRGLPGLVTLGCAVQGGESGAAVLRNAESGLELVAVLSSKTNLGSQPVAQASDVALRLPPLLDRIE